MNFTNTMTVTPKQRFLTAMRAGGVPDRLFALVETAKTYGVYDPTIKGSYTV
jgi:hypothetical protein